MPTNEIADPNVQEADQRALRAKASLLSRVELLKHKLTEARQQLDLPAQIAKHPLPAVGLAFALGALVGRWRRRSAPEGPAPGSLRSAVFATLTAIGMRVVRDVALAQLGHTVRQWWSGRGDEPATELAASSPPGDPFVAH